MVFKDLNRKALSVLGLIVMASSPAFANLNFIKDNTLFQSPAPVTAAASSPAAAEDHVSQEWNQILSKHQSWADQVDYDSSRYHVNYTFNEDLENFIKKQLALYRH